MSSSHTRRRTTSRAAVAVVLVLAFGAASCGGSDAPNTTDADVSSASASPTPTPTTTPTVQPTPTPTPTPTPLSAFEDRPQVQALRSWAAAAAQDVNARQHDFPTAREFQVDTAKVRRDVAFSWQQDFDKYYPGPLPFTPVAVTGSEGRSTVTTCVVSAGFSLKKEGGRPAEKREVVPVVFTMARQDGRWLLAGIVGGTADCAGVAVEPVLW